MRRQARPTARSYQHKEHHEAGDDEAHQVTPVPSGHREVEQLHVQPPRMRRRPLPNTPACREPYLVVHQQVILEVLHRDGLWCCHRHLRTGDRPFGAKVTAACTSRHRVRVGSPSLAQPKCGNRHAHMVLHGLVHGQRRRRGSGHGHRGLGRGKRNRPTGDLRHRLCLGRQHRHVAIVASRIDRRLDVVVGHRQVGQ